MKKNERAAKRARAEDIFKRAKRLRRETLQELGYANDSESDDLQMSDSEKNSKSMYEQLKMSYDDLKKEKEKVDEELKELENQFIELKKKHEDELKVMKKEVVQLRSLNVKLQERLLSLPNTAELNKVHDIACSNNVRNIKKEVSDPREGISQEKTQGEHLHATATLEGMEQVASDAEQQEVQLGEGISINKKTYKELFSLDHVRKFTKNLAVCIWGTSTLAGRSVTGKPCRNRNGPKKKAIDTIQTAAGESKPRLTPEKLAVVSVQMREYLQRRGKTPAEIEAELKHRNKYISDKIQEICYHLARNRTI